MVVQQTLLSKLNDHVWMSTWLCLYSYEYGLEERWI